MYSFNFDVEGEYNLVFSSLGYESVSERVMLVGDTAWVNIQLKTAALELEEIVVSASQRDPAFGIIKKVIEHKDRQLKAADSYRTKVYLKAVEETESTVTEVKEPVVEVDVSVPNADPFAAEAKADKELLNGLNLVEMEVMLNYRYPRSYKEERTAYQAYGNTAGLFIPIFAETDFNFYRNLVYLPGIADAPVISPFSNNAILSYKYELVGSRYVNGQHLNEIKVIPRKEGNSTVSGTVWIVEDEWTILKLELDLPKGTLLIGDNFRIEQSYTKEAYERDSEYWAGTRTEELDDREARLIRLRDSIQAVHNSPAYRDSLEGLYNRGDFSSWFRYDPFRLGDLSISGGRSFQAINEFDAYLNLLRPSNYILLDAVRATHAIEIANGLRIHTSFDWNDRRPITTYDVGSFLGDVVEDDDSPMDFERYQAFITTNTLSFTPGQRYMREPNRKVILGSKWPTLSLMHRRGWDKTFGSDIRFDYLEASLEQEIILGPIGNTHYRAQLGQFVNTEDLRFVDWKQFRESDPILYSNPLRTFQMLDTSLATTNLHFELHFIHHFNGAIINNIPLLKKTRIKTVAGGGVLWLKDGDYRHQEVFAGIERVFKVGPRRRLRVGLFGVLADANNRKPDTSFKISFDLIDVWKRDWSY
eukprot:g514.t1